MLARILQELLAFLVTIIIGIGFTIMIYIVAIILAILTGSFI